MPETTASLENAGEPWSEASLIRRIREGEHELFYELIRPYERRVFAAALAILRNEADAEDAAQEAMLKAFKHIRQFRAEARFSTWLIQIAVNEARMRRRKQQAIVMEPMVDRARGGRPVHATGFRRLERDSFGDSGTGRDPAETRGGIEFAGAEVSRGLHPA